jgi:peptidoglycan/LPS O-acetylase OafA/YrhL
VTTETALQQQPTETASTRQGFYLPGLDALRFYAFFAVFVMHCSPATLLELGFPVGLKNTLYVGAHSALGYGVPVFFCLSSFLITTLLLQEKEKTGKVHVTKFYVRRILRIWPVYYLSLLIGTVAVPLLHGQPPDYHWLAWLGTFAGNMHMSSPDHPPFSVAVLWSVCVEEQFYLVWPWVVRFLNRRVLERFALALVITAPLIRAFQGMDGITEWDIWFKTATHIDCFGLGALVALHWDSLTIERLSRYRVPLVSLGLLVTVGQATYAPFPGVNDYILGPLQTASYSLVALAAAMFVIAAGKRETSGSPVLLAGGKVSYGLYAYHGTVVQETGPLVYGWFWPLGFALRLVLILAWAPVSYRLMEKPLLNLKKKLQIVKSGN